MKDAILGVLSNEETRHWFTRNDPMAMQQLRISVWPHCNSKEREVLLVYFKNWKPKDNKPLTDALEDRLSKVRKQIAELES